jgi:large subunit ribosomal protein L18
MITKNRTVKRARIKRHIRLRMSGTSERPRLTVYRSHRHIYGQLVDDTIGRTLLSVSDLSKEFREQFKDLKGQMNISKHVGKILGEKAKQMNITSVVFDRNGYLYHGVVKAMADGVREAGLKF